MAASPRSSRFRRDVGQCDAQAGVGAGHGDAAAHRARADDRHRLDIARPRASFGRPGTLATFRSAKNACTSARPDPSARTRARSRARGGTPRRTAASLPLRSPRSPPVAPFDGAACFAPSRGPSQRAARSIRPSPVCRLGRGSSGCGAPRRTTSRANATAPSCRSPSITLIDQSGSLRVLGANRLAGHAHVDGFLHADESRQPLRPFGAWNDAEIDLRLTHPRVRNRDTIVPGHRKFQPAAERACRGSP